MLNRPDRMAFAHLPKTGGTYLIGYLLKHVLPDWTHLRITLRTARPRIDEAVQRSLNLQRVLVTTHYFTPTWKIDRELFQQYRRCEWFLFSFVRDPRDVLCSSYYYQRNLLHPARSNLCDEPFEESYSLDEYLRVMVGRSIIPRYWREYDFIAEFSRPRLEEFFCRLFDHQYQPQKPLNTSRNPGYAACCQAGRITPATQHLLASSENYQLFEQIQASSPWRSN